MKILFVTTDFYPEVGTSVNLIRRIIFDGSLLNKIDRISVLTVKRRINQKDYEYIEGVHVYRALCAGYISKNEYKSNSHILSFYRRVILGIQKLCLKIVSMVTKNKLLRGLNVNALVKKLKKIKEDEYDIIIPIFGNHDTVAAVMKGMNKNAKLVLYQVDPCSTNQSHSTLSKMKDRKFEQLMYDKADAIFTMDIFYKEIKEFISNELNKKFHPVELPLISEPKKVEVEKMNAKHPICLFSGLIYLGIRDPSYTYRLFKQMNRNGTASLSMVGVEEKDMPDEFKDDGIICYGQVDLVKAQQYINGADFLVNIGNSMINQLPSKIFDYFATGKPIINICKSKECPTIQYMNQYPLAINIIEDDLLFYDQVNEIEIFIKKNIGIVLPFDDVKNIFPQCTPSYVADQFLYVFNKLNSEFINQVSNK